MPNRMYRCVRNPYPTRLSRTHRQSLRDLDYARQLPMRNMRDDVSVLWTSARRSAGTRRDLARVENLHLQTA